MEEWDDEFFESLVKKKRCDDMERDEDSSVCVSAVASIAKNEKNEKNEPRINAEILGNCGGKTCIITGKTKTLRVKLGLTISNSSRPATCIDLIQVCHWMYVFDIVRFVWCVNLGCK